MKIGLSYSRCIRDIVEGRIDINDVLVVISRTDFDPHNDEQWFGVFKGYTNGSLWNMNCEWAGLEDREADLRNTTIELLETGKFHQPRQFGAHPVRRPEIWLETVLPSEELEKNPAAKKAWEKFQSVALLTRVELDTEYK